MVFNMLKGMKRLILTTAALCGVGLFLCGTKVMAAAPTTPTVTVSDLGSTKVEATDSKIKVNVLNNDSTFKLVVDKIDVYGATSKSTLRCSSSPAESLDASANKDYAFTNGNLAGNAAPTAAGTISVEEVVVTYYFVDSSGNYIKLSDGSTVASADKAEATQTSLSLASATAYEVSITPVSVDSTTKTSMDTATIANVYGFEGDNVTLTVTPPTGINPDNYNQALFAASGTVPAWYASGWEAAATSITKTVSSTSADNSYKIAYFPKIAGVQFTKITPESPDVETTGTPATATTVHLKGDKTDKVDITYKLISASGNAADDAVLANNGSGKTSDGIILLPDISSMIATGSNNIRYAKASDDGYKKITINLGEAAAASVNNALSNENAVGYLNTTYKVYHANGSTPDTPAVNGFTSGSIGVATVYPKATASTEGPIDIVLQPTETKTVDILGGTPAAADWATILNQAAGSGVTITVTPESGAAYTQPTATYSYDSTNKKGVLTFTSSSATENKTTTFKVEIKDKTVTSAPVVVTKTYRVKVETVSKDATETAIKNSNQNYITVGYKLDMNALLKDCVSSSSTKLGIAPTTITMSSSDVADYDSSSKILTGKKAGTVTLTATWGTVTVSVPVTVYPTPTATLNSGRTVTITLPKKVSTGYKADKNIKETTGFYFELLKSDDSQLFAYDSSKYNNVTGSSDLKSKLSYSESTYNYSVTVPASDVEGMVTTAGSNSKFSADVNSSTDVKFRATPMGVEATSSSTISAKDEIGKKAETSTTKVYCIQAYGDNFSSSYAYGLSGQSVSLTAYPASGYKFTKWKSSQSTRNPETITVTGTGQKYEVLGERIGANGSGTGTDNSSLYDDVPKTAESNSAVWLIVFMVFAVMGTAYALYLQLKAATSKHGR